MLEKEIGYAQLRAQLKGSNGGSPPMKRRQIEMEENEVEENEMENEVESKNKLDVEGQNLIRKDYWGN